MKPVRPLVAVLLTLAAVTIVSVPAQAVQIHRHLTVHREVRVPDTGALQSVSERVVRVVDVAPPYVPPAPRPTATAPPAPYAPTPVSAPTTVPTTSGGCPSSLAGESTSPTAVNASSGASGCIQALPSTWAAYGDPAYASAADAPVSVQLEAMARICAAQGNGAWVAADPC